MKNLQPQALKFQRGAAALLTVVILLIATTLIVIYSGRVTIQEHRITGNDSRAKIASANAEAGLNIAISTLKVTPPGERRNDWGWAACQADQPPCEGTVFGNSGTWSFAQIDTFGNDCDQSDEEGFCATYFSQTPDLNYASVTIVSQGHADSANATAVVTQTVAKYNFFASAVGRIPPVMTPSPSIGGNMTIIPNPNANGIAGQSNPISVWSSGPMAFPGNGSMQTCGALFDGGSVGDAQCLEPAVADAFGRTVDSFNQCGCSDIDENYSTGVDEDGRRRPYSAKDNFGTDIVQNDGAFPDDMFEFFFGVPGAEWQSIKDISKVYGSCNNNPAIDDDTNPGDIIWIEGDCDLKDIPDGQLGSRFVDDGGRGPVILVIEGNLDYNGTEAHVWGIVYVIDQDGVSNEASEVKLNGTPYIHGALLADRELDLGSGSITIMYDAEMLNAVKASEDTEITVPTDFWLPRSGSWLDFVPVN